MNYPAWVVNLGKQINAEILSHLNWIGIPTSPEDGSTECSKKTESFRLLDYACGEGQISRGIFNYVDEAWGVDLSARMVESYNQHATTFNVPERKRMFAVQGDMLASGENNMSRFTGKEWFGFDVAIMSMALHHVISPDHAVKMLVERVKEGCSVLIVDWISGTTERPTRCEHNAGAGEMPGAQTTTREGFTKAEMEKMLLDAGCQDVGFMQAREPSYLDLGEQRLRRTLFLAKGKKGKGGSTKV
ncbi:MAG: hypothetical protein Q9209_004746 [Squamulea sp. 1 TL-2023]